MRAQTRKANPRVVASLPFVEQLARRVAATMPHSIDLGDLVQDGVIGLIDAAERFDEKRGIKFETFAERRVRGAMIDALRRDAWPRGVRRQRRELEAAREALRRELGCEPSLADLAARVGSDEKKLGRTIVRINTIEATSPLNSGENMDDASMPAVLMPSEPEQPDSAYEREETRERVRAAIATLPSREQTVIGLYYFNDATMKQIGAEIGVNESRVSQLHARAIRKLRAALAVAMTPAQARAALLAFAPRPQMVKAELNTRHWTESGGRSNNGVTPPGVVVRMATAVARAAARPAPRPAAARPSSAPRAKAASRPRAAVALAR
ncbi:MAG: sigma-70 family RNA polymerase sigma factor [Vicinamibacterales bacterium]